VANDDPIPPRKKLSLRVPGQATEPAADGEDKTQPIGAPKAGPRSHAATVSSQEHSPTPPGARPKVTVKETGEIETANIRAVSANSQAPAMPKPRVSVSSQQPTDTTRPLGVRPGLSTKPGNTTQDDPGPAARVSDTTAHLRPRQAPSPQMAPTDSTTMLRRKGDGTSPVQKKGVRDTSKSMRRKPGAGTPAISDTTMAIRNRPKADAPTEDSELVPPPRGLVSDGTVALQKKDRDSSKSIRRRRRVGSIDGEAATVDSAATDEAGATTPSDTTQGIRRRPVAPSAVSTDSTRALRAKRRLATQIAPAMQANEFATEDSESAPPPGASANDPALASGPSTRVENSTDETAAIRARVKSAPTRGGGSGPQPSAARPGLTDTSTSISRRAIGTDTASIRARPRSQRPVDPTATSTLRAKPIVPGRPATAPGVASPAASSRDQATARLKRVPRPGTTVPGISDPMAARDGEGGAGVLHIRPGDERRPSSAEDTLDTETVHLKVIKEKKKQLAGILSASQTIRLRPSPGPQQVSQTGTVQQPPPAVGAGEGAQRRTLKVKGPAAQVGETPTARLTRADIKTPSTEASEPGLPTAKSKKRPTLKIKAPAVDGETPTQDSDAIPPPSRPAAGEDQVSTLKIKAPTQVESAAPERAASRSTLKIKPPQGKPSGDPVAAPEAAPAEEEAQRTTRRAAKKKEKTLRLKQPAGKTKATTDDEAEPTTASEDLASGDDVAPGILYTLTSVAALAAVGCAVYLTVVPYMELFQ